MQYGIKNLSHGAGALAQAMLGASGREGAAYAKELGMLQQGRSRAAQARKYDAEADLKSMQRDELAGLGETLGPLASNMGLGPENIGSLASVLRAGQGNAGQLAEAMRTFSDGTRTTGAVDAYRGGNTGLANFMLQAANRKAYTPYEQNAQGSVLDTGTGVVDQANPIAKGTIGHLMAQAADEYASAGQHNATAGLRRAETATEQARPALVVAQTDAADALATQRRAAPEGSNAIAIKKAELMAQGVPEELASSIATGTVKTVRDPMGMRTQFIDIASGQVVAEIDAQGRLLRNPQVYGGMPPGAPAGAVAGTPSDPLGILDAPVPGPGVR